ncbi:hypothetical protein DPMN_148396 [Dreissena polymorpha]|uniref:Uncharacterized protein n=1 Tax=Dreissena polymorpha TaxID=45954 RepID=A0A9D4F9X2_DREPO|nr:hypothetical protein DPMN_148396 [Dreissena polymorpha]
MRTACYSGAKATAKRRCHGYNALIGAILFANAEYGYAKWFNAVTDYILRYTGAISKFDHRDRTCQAMRTYSRRAMV